MRIERIREDRVEGWDRIMADVIWEDREAPAQTLVIQARDPFGADLQPSCDAMLVALLPLAQWMGERRVRIEGTICCRLRDGLGAATDLFSLWYQRCGPLRIEPSHGFAPTVPRREPRAASLLSGGIDALSLLRANRLEYRADHPGFIRDCFLLFGLNSFDADAEGPKAERLAVFDALVARMEPFAARAGAMLIPIRTNIRALYPDYVSWQSVGFGAGMLSAALSMPGRIDRVELGSAGVAMRQPPRGSHPWLDHHYSTEAVTVRHAQVPLSRFEKTRLVSDWADGLAVLRTCFYQTIPAPGLINCGECEKCIRTMLALVALGKLDRAPTFAANDVSPSMLDCVHIDDQLGVLYYSQCIDALIARNREDLAGPLRQKIDAFRRRERRQRLRALVKKIVRFGR
ncbi:MAG TPA: hypothetical protein VJ650_05755 [Gemmatimonadaceae bacterium]|nr:hypothetical protein [Gemmatimonadaceae bacterium]